MTNAVPSLQVSSLLILGGMIAVIATVLGFEHIGGYIPCALCLQQRVPYYVAIPGLLLALVGATFMDRTTVLRIGLAFALVAMLIAAGLGAYHAGVEWAWWEGPTTCGAVAQSTFSNADSLLDQLATTRPPSCNEAAGRFLGLSFAGWNVVVSLVLAIAAAFALRKPPGVPA